MLATEIAKQRDMSPLANTLEPMAKEATTLLKALAHPSRLIICCQLKSGEASVGELEATLGIKQPNLSRELAKLREAGIVETRRASKVIFYTLTDERVKILVDTLCGIMMGDADMDEVQA